MNLIYLSLGSNLGRREQNLNEAVKLIQQRIGRMEAISSYYDSEAWGYTSENRFCNCCISIRSALGPLPLLDLLQDIEAEMGRGKGGAGYSDRIIDIDMLLYGHMQMDHPRLSLPHPSMGDRRFVLVPLAEMAPELIHPVSGISIREMLEQCSDQSEVLPAGQDLFRRSSSQNI
ncbi:MAG: 2-amino-4-hydroxy-6-hydroxymethyldihydropteridine diphosphokinase [Bacteroidales bacterium]|nr:2-amino-4-hydroxy-6-hydroxymethyldihydropteridine diphosphokinase [Bacteroidales bacterium]